MPTRGQIRTPPLDMPPVRPWGAAAASATGRGSRHSVAAIPSPADRQTEMPKTAGGTGRMVREPRGRRHH